MASGGISASNGNGLAVRIQNLLNEYLDKKEARQLIPCIWRVPDELRMPNESAYCPRVVSIGPLHGNKNETRREAMEEHKVGYMDNLFVRMGSDLNRIVKECAEAMVHLEEKARQCYAELKLDKLRIDFAAMMLIDGCFILELLLRYHLLSEGKEKKNPHDSIFTNNFMLSAVRHDLLLLENQIPFFVLEKLFELTVKHIHDLNNSLSLTDFVLPFFGNMLNPRSNKLQVREKKTEIYHILDLLHKCYFPSGAEAEKAGSKSHHSENGERKLNICSGKQQKKNFKFHRSATELERAGVKLKAGNGEDPFNVKFSTISDCFCGLYCCYCFCSRARFEIPPLVIDDFTEPFLRNLIAFEQCRPDISSHITSYAFLLDTLINCAKDVELLKEAGIIHSYLGANEEATNLFNNICKEVVLGDSYLDEPCIQMEEYCSHWWPNCVASLRRDYFSSPWAVISVFAALILFAITVLQTVYTLLSYY